MTTLEAGLDFGGYVLERRLGIGGMAEVWAARSGEPGSSMVALKLLAQQHARDPSYVAMFIDEAALGARLRHRATVPIEACFQANDTFCQVMPLVDGRDLRRVFIDAQKRKAEFPWPLAIYIAHEVACALEYAHALEDDKGRPLELVHRDVSPQNIMIARDGRVLLLDFGIAKARERLARTSVGVVKGKLGYMSPRRIVGKGATPGCDVWSLGVTCWEMLAMRPLFASVEMAEVGPRIVRREIPTLSSVRPGLPDEVYALVSELLGDDAIDTAATAARRLRTVLRSSGLTQVEAPVRLAKWANGLVAPRPATAVLPVQDEPTVALSPEDTADDLDATVTMK